MRITFLGHSSVLIEDGDFKALIDPFLTGNPMYTERESDTTGITHIFITHAHGDHIGDSLEIAEKNNALIISNAEIISYLRSKNKDLHLHPMHIGGRYKFSFATVKMTPAVHGSSIKIDGKMYDGGSPGGFVISRSGKKIYHSGDTGLTMDMKLLQEEKIDLAFLPIGGNFTMDIDDAVRAVGFIEPEITVPIHYNTFGYIKADPEEFAEKLSDYYVKILSPGSSIEI